MSERAASIAGKRFGKLLVLSEVAEGCFADKRRAWICKCDCGRVVRKSQSHLLHRHTKSCGKCKPTGFAHPRFSGIGALSGDHWWRIKNNAKTRNFSFEITKEYVWDLFVKQGGRCAISGFRIFFQKRNRCWCRSTASLDRIDNRRGYEIGNVQWVHKDINWMKLNFSPKYFLAICKAVCRTNEQNNGKR